MSKKIRWITETAIMLALLVTLQALTKGFGQFVTGSCVNAVLAVAVLLAGLWVGTPVFCEFRYAYPLILSLPLILGVSWYRKSE